MHYSSESLTIQRTPWSFVSSHPRSLAGSEQGRGVDRPQPAKGGVGGEKGEVRELEGTTAHL